MKKIINAHLFITLLIALCCLLPGCDNAFGPPANGGPAAATADGYGKLRIRFAGEVGRTTFPANDLFEYEYTFYKCADAERVEVTELETETVGEQTVYILEYGDWELEVAACIDDDLVATGFSRFTIESSATKQIIITLEAIIPEEDPENGLFSYTIFYPEDAGVSIITLEKLPFSEDYAAGLEPEELEEDLEPGQGGITETEVPVPAGFYLLTVVITLNGKYTGTNEVIHIYPQLETTYEKEFFEDDFLETTVSIAEIEGLTVPVRGETPVETITETAQYTGTVEWFDGDTPFDETTFDYATTYTAEITLTAKSGYTFAGVAADFFIVEGADAVSNDQHTGVITAVFPETEAVPPEPVDIAEIEGVTAPAHGATPVTTITPTDQYTGTVEWSPDDVTFQAGIEYTATITLTAEQGYTFTGVAEDFFSVEGTPDGTAVRNEADTGVVTVEFPVTPHIVVDIPAIEGITFPEIGQEPVTVITSSMQYTGTVEWYDNEGLFDSVEFEDETIYYAIITLTAETGYTFTGVPANFFTVEGAGTTNAAGSGVITAKFIHKVTFMDDSSEHDIVYVSHGELVGKPADPPSSGDKFAGWFMDANCNEESAVLRRWRFDLYPVIDDLTLYARWLPGTYEELDKEELLNIFQPGENGEKPEYDLEGEFFLTDDIDLRDFDPEGPGWVPIGGEPGEGQNAEHVPFRGTFDGNGCIVKYMHAARPDQPYVGFFSAIRDATVRNLGLELGVSGIVGSNDVGGITGNAKHSLIENCFVKGDIVCGGSVGAIAGHIGEGAKVRNCYTTGTITSTGSDAGGIVGNTNQGITIENCYSTMTVTAVSDTGGIVARVGGHGGAPAGGDPYGDSFIINCVAINDSISSPGDRVGRIVGRIGSSPDDFIDLSVTLHFDNNYARDDLNPFVGEGNDHDGTTVSDNDLLTTRAFYEDTLGWKFGSDDAWPWKMPIGGGYPILYWEKED